MAAAKTTGTKRTNGREKLARNRPVRPPSMAGASGAISSPFASELLQFADQFSAKREGMILSVVETAGKRGGPKTKQVKVPYTTALGMGASEKSLMMALGWYWEPLPYDLAFFEEMRDSITLIDGEIQKLLDVALDGFALHCDDPQKEKDLNKALVRNKKVRLREVFRRAMLDLYSLGNHYEIPIWTKDLKGRAVPIFKPVRANAMRVLRDENLQIEGYVQLLHRPSEFIFGQPSTPTIWLADQVLSGQMRTKHWNAYGTPLLASLPFVLRIKLQMERELAEMLHQHLPRLDITYTPEEQLNNDQILEFKNKIVSEVSQLKPTDNFVHTPDIENEYIGPGGHSPDFTKPQEHIESQLFYIFPFSPAIMGLNSTANPYDSQQRWTLASIIAQSLRDKAEEFFAPVLDELAQKWGLDEIRVGYNQLDPERSSTTAEAEEYQINNANLKRDGGYIDQDAAARQATSMHKGGPVKKAAKPGPLPPPLDPNKQLGPNNPGGKTPANRKVRKMGPKTDGTRVPDNDKRKPGKRHSQSARFGAYVNSALERLTGGSLS